VKGSWDAGDGWLPLERGGPVEGNVGGVRVHEHHHSLVVTGGGRRRIIAVVEALAGGFRSACCAARSFLHGLMLARFDAHLMGKPVHEALMAGLPCAPMPTMPRNPTHPTAGMSRRSACVVTVTACSGSSLLHSVSAQPSLARRHDKDIEVVRAILQQPEAEIDLAKAKVTIDRLIDPSIDAAATLAQLDAMAKSLRAMLPAGASKRLILDALRYHVYKASPWNNNRPFRYDLDDPFGENIRNKLLSSYLATRKGNCISMPMLFIILGQKLGIVVTAATAPNHVFVKYRDEAGQWHNLEATSGAGFTRDVWMRQQFPMTDEALASGIYMRPLTKKETVVVMVGTLLELYDQQQMHKQRIALARLALEFDPRDVAAILHQHSATLRLYRLLVKQRSDVNPVERQVQALRLDATLRALYEEAIALGWRPLDPAAEERYRQSVERARSTQ
jgi:hypothetical protein